MHRLPGGCMHPAGRRLPARCLTSSHRGRASIPRPSSRALIAKWLESGLLHPEPLGDAERELLDRDPAAEHHRRAAHGARAQRRRSRTRSIRHHADARAAHEVDLRHRSREHRDAAPGRAAARAAGNEPRRSSAARRSSSGPGAGASATARRSSSSTSAWARRATTPTSASRSTSATRTRSSTVFVALYERGLIHRDNYMVNWDPGSRVGDLRPRGRGARGDRHAVLGSPTRWPTAPASSSSRRCARRRCSPTRRSRCNPDDERYRELVGREVDPAARRAAAAGDRRRATSSRSSARGR